MKLKPYPEYKDSGVEWIGEIPEDWNINKIKNTSYVKGRIGWHGLSSEEYANEGAYLVTGTNLKSGNVNWDTCHHISWERYKEDPYIHLREDDLLITKDGTIGKVAVVKNIPDKATLNSGIFVVRPLNDDYVPDFMYWILNSSVFKRYFDYIKTGATIAHLYQETFERFFFPIPSETEQIKIINFLNEKTSEIDLIIEKDTRLIELLKEKRTALINHVVTKGLDPTVKMKDSRVEWIGEIPEDWEVKKIKYCTKINKNSLPENCDPDYEFFYLDISNVSNNGEIKNTEFMRFENAPSRARRITQKYDTIISTVRTYLKAIAYLDNVPDKFVVSTGFSVLNPGRNIFPRYLFYVVSSEYFVQNVVAHSKGIAYPAINSSDLANLHILYPYIKVQKEISTFLDKKTSNIDFTIQKIQENIDLLEEYKKSLIHHVVTGKIDVRKVAV